jgi:hypothetical protein
MFRNGSGEQHLMKSKKQRVLMFIDLRRRAIRVARTGALLALLAGATPQGWAWGHEGHRLTALVAEHYLSPYAQAQVAELLHGQSMASIASWADDYRQEHPETGPWHYVDIPASATTFDRMRDCPPSAADAASPWRDCVTDRILYFEGRLGDTSLSEPERERALKFLVHLIGDVHQPFHALGDERGGNNIGVSFMGSSQCGQYKCNLHGVWDESLIEHRDLNEKKYTAELLHEIDENHWERLAGGQPTSWAEVSHHYAMQGLAPNGSLLSSAYVNEETHVVDAQLALGGLRLAHVLNRILAPPDPADTPQRTLLPKPSVDSAPKRP